LPFINLLILSRGGFVVNGYSEGAFWPVRLFSGAEKWKKTVDAPLYLNICS